MFNTAKVWPHLHHQGDEEEDESEDETPLPGTSAQAAPATQAAQATQGQSPVKTLPTITIIVPMALNMGTPDLPLPPRAATQCVKKHIRAIVNPIINRAAERASNAAREAWLSRLEVRTVELVPSSPCEGITDIWQRVQRIPQNDIYWAGGSFTSEKVMMDYMRPVFNIIQEEVGAPLHVKILDTHKRGMKNPPCRPDATLIRGDSRHVVGQNVGWAEMVGGGKLKRVRSGAKKA